MIIAAALCPWPPLLASELTGNAPVLPELRQACGTAIQWLLREQPELVTVVGPADATRAWDPGSQPDLSVFAPSLPPAGDPDLPPSLGLGALLLNQAGYAGHRALQAVAEDEPTARCAELGAAISGTADRMALLAMGDGSARRSPKAPGYFDERSMDFDAQVERALRDGDLDALLAISPALASELMASGRPSWQVLAGALGPAASAAEILYSDVPFGVSYIVACIEPKPPG